MYFMSARNELEIVIIHEVRVRYDYFNLAFIIFFGKNVLLCNKCQTFIVINAEFLKQTTISIETGFKFL